MRTAEETALLVALLLKRSEKNRARISRQTVLRLSKRSIIRTAFLNMLKNHLDDLGIILIELERGGYGIIPSTALEGAPAITAKRYMDDKVNGRIRFGAIRKEIEQDVCLEEIDEV